MKTRRKREQIEKHRRHQRELQSRELVLSFFNPYSTYKIAEVSNFCFDEELGEPKMSLQSFFKWNRISSATNHSDYISFGLTPYRAESSITPEYVIERFKSFGNQQSYQFALKLDQLVKSNNYTSEEALLFPDSRQLVRECGNPNWVVIRGGIEHGQPRRTAVDISHAFCKKFSLSPEQMMALCVKYGDFPIRTAREVRSTYAQSCESFAELMLLFKRMAQQKRVDAIKSIANRTRKRQNVVYTSVLNVMTSASQVTGRAILEMGFPSPTDVVLLVDDVKEEINISEEWRTCITNAIDLSEYLALKKVMGWQEEKLKKPGALSCKYRLTSEK